jgi:GNAT superfamily N-acetyltransferase
MQAPRQPTQLTWLITQEAVRVHTLHCEVLERTPDGMVRPDPLSHFEAHAGAAGQTLGCYAADGTLAGYGILGLHSHTVSHLAGMLGADAAALCVLDGAAALPEWRGYGIHRLAIAHRIALARSLGRTQVAATVAPENVRSMRGLLDAGLRIRQFANLYGGLPRLVLQGELALGHSPLASALCVPVRDLAAHRSAIDAGLTGYACRKVAEDAWVVDYAAG